MTACAECGGPVDPDVTHPQHAWGCHKRDCIEGDCDCPEVCSACCQDPDCPTRAPQETTMTDPQPLTDDEFAFTKDGLAAGARMSGIIVERLVATVEQVRRERDDLRAVIRRMDDGWLDVSGAARGWFWSKYDIRKGDGGVPDEPMTPAEVDAIRRARAGTGETDG